MRAQKNVALIRAERINTGFEDILPSMASGKITLDIAEGRVGSTQQSDQTCKAGNQAPANELDDTRSALFEGMVETPNPKVMATLESMAAKLKADELLRTDDPSRNVYSKNMTKPNGDTLSSPYKTYERDHEKCGNFLKNSFHSTVGLRPPNRSCNNSCVCDF